MFSLKAKLTFFIQNKIFNYIELNGTSTYLSLFGFNENLHLDNVHAGFLLSAPPLPD